jgi:hypothetical protein
MDRKPSEYSERAVFAPMPYTDVKIDSDWKRAEERVSSGKEVIGRGLYLEQWN